jgi:hypothetical protein
LLSGHASANAPVTLLLDTFEGPDSATVGNGWIELEDPGAEVRIQDNRLVFLSTVDTTNRPMLRKTFSRTTSGQLIWDFEFDWSRSSKKGSYRLFMQLGDSAVMNPSSADAGVGVNMIWGKLSGRNRLSYRLGGTDTALAQVSGPMSIRVVVDLDQANYDILVNGIEIGALIPLDGALALDSIRLFTDSVKLDEGFGGTFDTIELTAIADVEPANVAPVATSQSLSVAQDTPSDIVLGYTDTDGPGPSRWCRRRRTACWAAMMATRF